MSNIPRWHVGLECGSCDGASHTHTASVKSLVLKAVINENILDAMFKPNLYRTELLLKSVHKSTEIRGYLEPERFGLNFGNGRNKWALSTE